MECTYSLKSNKKVVDIPATARLLKQLRLEHGYSVVQLKKRRNWNLTLLIMPGLKCKNMANEDVKAEERSVP